MAEAWIYDKGSVLDENGFKVAAFVDEEDASTICNAPINEKRVRILREALADLLSYAEPWAIDEQREFRESIAAARAALEATKEDE